MAQREKTGMRKAIGAEPSALVKKLDTAPLPSAPQPKPPVAPIAAPSVVPPAELAPASFVAKAPQVATPSLGPRLQLPNLATNGIPPKPSIAQIAAEEVAARSRPMALSPFSRFGASSAFSSIGYGKDVLASQSLSHCQGIDNLLPVLNRQNTSLTKENPVPPSSKPAAKERHWRKSCGVESGNLVAAADYSEFVKQACAPREATLFGEGAIVDKGHEQSPSLNKREKAKLPPQAKGQLPPNRTMAPRNPQHASK